MSRKGWLWLLALPLLLAACAPALVSRQGGWGGGLQTFASNGERLYYTATNEQGQQIGSSAGQTGGMGMMSTQLACASCHGSDGRGGNHQMHMQTMDAPDIRWTALSGQGDDGGHEQGDAHHHDDGGYDLETFRMAVVEGEHPDGQSLSSQMPRWQMDDADLADLFAYLQSLP